MTDIAGGARVPEQPTLVGLEERWSRRWQEEGTYAFDRSQDRAHVYAIDTPPPTVSGPLHIGHVYSYTHTDLIARFQAHEIIRTWLYSTVVRSRAEHGTLPWHTVDISGWVVTPDKQKISKSKANAIGGPMELIDRSMRAEVALVRVEGPATALAHLAVAGSDLRAAGRVVTLDLAGSAPDLTASCEF